MAKRITVDYSHDEDSEVSKDYYIVSDDETIVYGDAPTKILALLDYIVSLIEYCEITKHRIDNDLIIEAVGYIRKDLEQNPPEREKI